MQSSINQLENGNIEITLSIPWSKVEETYQIVVDDIVKEAELPGFRKGKAPKEKVEESLDKNKAYEEVLKRLIPQAYAEAVKEHSLKPVISPQVTLTNAKEGQDWTVTAVTCEKPTITLGNYKEKIADLKNAKRNTIWTPGQDTPKPVSINEEKGTEDKDKKPSLNELLDKLYQAVTVTLPPILVEQEVTRMISGFLDQTKKLGITLDQYLQSTGKTAETLRKEYEDEAKKTLTLELALGEIADQEHINVEESELEEVIKTAKTPEEKAGLEKEKYYLASILRRQKTLQLLAGV